MPLDREHLTYASGIMLPAYVVLSGLFGLVYILDPGGRLHRAPSVTFQRQVMPLWCWGCIMLALAVLMLIAYRVDSRTAFAYALCCVAVTWFIWGCAIATSILLTPDTSFLAPVLPWFVTTCCIASTKSLIREERRG